MVLRTGRGKLLVWWKGGLARETASVMVDWNKKIFSVVDGFALGTASGWMDYHRKLLVYGWCICVL